MRFVLLLCILAISGCVAQPVQDARVPALQYEVRALKEEVAELSSKLDKTTKTAVSARVSATKNAAKVEDVKKVAEKASDTALNAVLETQDVKSPIPETEKKSVILKPREINHETSLLPE